MKMAYAGVMIVAILAPPAYFAVNIKNYREPIEE